MLHMWFHFNWPNCGALRVRNHILTDLPTDTRLWASLAPAWRQIDSCSFTQAHTNLPVFHWNRAFIHCLQMECSQYYTVNLVIKLNLFLHLAGEMFTQSRTNPLECLFLVFVRVRSHEVWWLVPASCKGNVSLGGTEDESVRATGPRMAGGQ